jgi:predicted N-acetyltransferase YhbS
MLQIRTMRFEDIPFAIRLTDQEKWGVTRSDLTRILKLNPAGSFIANEGPRRVGLITTTRYGRKLAWIGNVIVDRKHRGKRIGHSLVQKAVEYLQRSKAEHIALYCFNENVTFYRRLGFVSDAPFVRLRRKTKPFPSTPLASAAYQRLPLRSVLASDKKAFGADRSKLIRMVLRTRTAWYFGFSNGPNASSYLLVKKFKDMFELGPWVCIDPPNGQPREMLSLALARITGKPVEVSCFQHHPAFALLRKNGFRTMSHGYRMFFGKISRIDKREANYALGFLDKG